MTGLFYTGFVRGLKNLKSFGNLSFLVPGLEVLEIWENPIKTHGYWHFGHGDFIFPNVYLAFSPQLILSPSYQHYMTKEVGNHCVQSSW
jgi:hypothetical protein